MTIIEYHRPSTFAEALALLARTDLLTVPLGGGTRLNAPDYQRAHFVGDFAVVDVQALGLNTLTSDGTFIEAGAALTLQGLLEAAPALPGGSGLPPALLQAARLETTFNLRQVATVAGTLAAADGQSPFATAMLALDARLTVLAGAGPSGAGPSGGGPAGGGLQGDDPASSALRLGDLLARPALPHAGGRLSGARLAHSLITHISLPAAARLAYEYVARTPADRPIVCAAVARWPSGRTRVCLGGFGPAPVLAMDGPEADGAEMAARAAYSQAGDEWASAEYRQEMAAVLTKRCWTKLNSPGG